MSGETPTLFVRRASGLVRTVGPWTALATALSWTIGGGVNWLLVKVSYDYPGANVPLAFLIVGIASVITAVAYTYLLMSMPRTGGDYVYMTRGINPLLGFVLSWGYWIATAIAVGTIAFWDVWYWGLSLQIGGAALGDRAMLDLGNQLATNADAMLILGTVFTVGMGLVSIFGLRAYSRLIWVLFAIPVVGSLVFFGAMLAGQGGAQALWDATFGAGTWQQILQAAQEAGWDPATYTTFSWDATAGALLSPMFAFVGSWAMVTYIGGEVKDVKRSAVWGGVLAVVVIAVYMVGAAFLLYGAFGEFVSAYTYLFMHSKETQQVLASIMPYSGRPMLPLFAAGLLPGQPALQLIVALMAALWLLNDVPAFYLVSTRLPFAWSFDRFFPEKFAEVNKYGSPTYSVMLATAIGEISVIWWWLAEKIGYSGAVGFINTMDGISTYLWWFPSVFGGMAAVVLPFMRRDLYERSPLRHEVAGVPVMSIAGILTVLFNLWLYLALVGANATISDMFWIALFYSIGAAVFVGYVVYNQKRGVDVKTLFQEIPPT